MPTLLSHGAHAAGGLWFPYPGRDTEVYQDSSRPAGAKPLPVLCDRPEGADGAWQPALRLDTNALHGDDAMRLSVIGTGILKDVVDSDGWEGSFSAVIQADAGRVAGAGVRSSGAGCRLVVGQDGS